MFAFNFANQQFSVLMFLMFCATIRIAHSNLLESKLVACRNNSLTHIVKISKHSLSFTLNNLRSLKFESHHECVKILLLHVKKNKRKQQKIIIAGCKAS